VPTTKQPEAKKQSIKTEDDYENYEEDFDEEEEEELKNF